MTAAILSVGRVVDITSISAKTKTRISDDPKNIVLVADCGGTTTKILAIEEGSDIYNPVIVLPPVEMDCGEYRSLDELLEAYRDAYITDSQLTVQKLIVDVAGQVDLDQIEGKVSDLTNIKGWSIVSKKKNAAVFGLDMAKTDLVNDLTAGAAGYIVVKENPELIDKKGIVLPLNNGRKSTSLTRYMHLSYIGTGIGEGGIWVEHDSATGAPKYYIRSLETGKDNFVTSDPRLVKYVEHLTDRGQRGNAVTNESIAAGDSLYELYAYLLQTDYNRKEPEWLTRMFEEADAAGISRNRVIGEVASGKFASDGFTDTCCRDTVDTMDAIIGGMMHRKASGADELVVGGNYVSDLLQGFKSETSPFMRAFGGIGSTPVMERRVRDTKLIGVSNKWMPAFGAYAVSQDLEKNDSDKTFVLLDSCEAWEARETPQTPDIKRTQLRKGHATQVSVIGKVGANSVSWRLVNNHTGKIIPGVQLDLEVDVAKEYGNFQAAASKFAEKLTDYSVKKVAVAISGDVKEGAATLTRAPDFGECTEVQLSKAFGVTARNALLVNSGAAALAGALTLPNEELVIINKGKNAPLTYSMSVIGDSGLGECDVMTAGGHKRFIPIERAHEPIGPMLHANEFDFHKDWSNNNHRSVTREQVALERSLYDMYKVRKQKAINENDSDRLKSVAEIDRQFVLRIALEKRKAIEAQVKLKSEDQIKSEVIRDIAMGRMGNFRDPLCDSVVATQDRMIGRMHGEKALGVVGGALIIAGDGAQGLIERISVKNKEGTAFWQGYLGSRYTDAMRHALQNTTIYGVTRDDIHMLGLAHLVETIGTDKQSYTVNGRNINKKAKASTATAVPATSV